MEARPWSDGKTVTYRYHPPGQRPVNLGTDKNEACRRVLSMQGDGKGAGTLRWVWFQWQTSKRWLKLSEGTRADYGLAWKQLDKKFGMRQAGNITAPEMARYVHITRAGSPRRADIELTLASMLFKHGIMLGVCTLNPCTGVERHGSEPSTVMPSDLAMKAFADWLSAQGPQRKRLALAMRFDAVVGARQCEFLPLTWQRVDRDDKGVPVLGGLVRITRAKQRGKRRDQIIEGVEITPALHAILCELQALVPEEGAPYLFPTDENNQYTAKGFKTLWQRCIKAAIDAKVITPAQRFNFHSLRRYYNTMHLKQYGDHANLHENKATTIRVYTGPVLQERKAL